jgi:glutathione gamma-glutamylcysteinyltransferase
VKVSGVTMQELFCLALCNNLAGSVAYACEKDERAFRDMVKHVTKLDNIRLLAGYNRRVLGQTGTGHFSPIGMLYINMILM